MVKSVSRWVDRPPCYRARKTLYNRFVRWGNNVYFGKVVPKIGALLSDGAAYRYLPKSVAYLPSRQQMLTDLRLAGFTDAQHRQLSGGLTQLMTGTRR